MDAGSAANAAAAGDAAALTARNLRSLQQQQEERTTTAGRTVSRRRAPSVSTVSSVHSRDDKAHDVNGNDEEVPVVQKRTPVKAGDSTLGGVSAPATPSRVAGAPPPGACWVRLTCAPNVSLTQIRNAVTPLGALRVHVDSDSTPDTNLSFVVGNRPVPSGADRLPLQFSTALVLFPSRRAVRDAAQSLAESPPGDPAIALLWSAALGAPSLSVVSMNTRGTAVVSHLDRSLSVVAAHDKSLDSSRLNTSSPGLMAGASPRNSPANASSATASPSRAMATDVRGRVDAALRCVDAAAGLDDALLREAAFEILDATAFDPTLIGCVVLPRLMGRLGQHGSTAVVVVSPPALLLARLLASGLLGPGTDPFVVVVSVLSHAPPTFTAALMVDLLHVCAALQVTTWAATSLCASQAALACAALSRNRQCSCRVAARELYVALATIPAVHAYLAAIQGATPLLSYSGGRSERKRRTVLVRPPASVAATLTAVGFMEWVVTSTLPHAATVDRVRVCRLGRRSDAPIAAFVECTTEADAQALLKADATTEASVAAAAYHVESARQCIGDDMDPRFDALFTATGDCVRPCLFGRQDSGAGDTAAAVTLVSLLSDRQ